MTNIPSIWSIILIIVFDFVANIKPVFSSASNPLSLKESILSALATRRAPAAFQSLEEQAANDRIRRWIPNSPQLQYTNADNQSWQTFGVNFNLGFPGRPILFHQLDRSKQEAAISDSYARRHDVFKEVIAFYVDCAQSSYMSLLYKDFETDLQALSQTLSTLYSTGHATQTEMIAAQLQTRQGHNEALALKNKSVNACKRLAEYLGVENVVTEPLPSDIEPTFLQELQLRDPAELERSRAKKTVAEAQSSAPSLDPLFPQFQFGAYYNRYLVPISSPLGMNVLNTWTYSLSMTFPLFIATHERAEFKRQRATAIIEAASAEIEEQNTRSEIRGAILEFLRVKERLKALQAKDLDLADAMVQSTLSNYRHGKLGFSELLLSRKMRLDLKTEEIQLKVTLLKLRAICLSACTNKENTK